MVNSYNRIIVGFCILLCVLSSYLFDLDIYFILIVSLLSLIDLIKSKIIKLKYSYIFLLILTVLILFAEKIPFNLILIIFILCISMTIKFNKYSKYFFTLSIIIFLYSFYLLGMSNRDLFYTLIILSFINDSLAYVFGNLIKGPLIIPTISPKKTWSGTITSLLVSFSLLIFLKFSILISLIVSLSYFVGDLFFSFYKRKSNLKDFSSIFMSHGGILDRIDSMYLIFIIFNISIFFPS